MKKLIYFFIIAGIVSCRGNREDEEPAPDAIPDQQSIVYTDTSGLTGELRVLARYYDAQSQLNNAPSGTYVSLYASYDDLVAGLSLYDVFTTNDTAYFGFINYGNYYVKSDVYVDTTYYYGEAALQIRPDREEELTITMY